MTNRRQFFKNTSLLGLGGLLFNPLEVFSAPTSENIFKNKKAKNIILLVSDGMSSGTLSMANIFKERMLGKSSHWIQLYQDNLVSRALMDTASASSIITDSAAAGSSWGSGFRVNNGSLNVGVNGEEYLPIWQKFKKKGKKAGCVTTVPITHATPASFCVSEKSRNSQEKIAEQYLQLRFDVMMGGGYKYFGAELREDKKDILSDFKKNGFTVIREKSEFSQISSEKPVLGIFAEDGLPYTVDHQSNPELKNKVPTLAEMTQQAIDAMKDHTQGFVLQVEAGKVDWAAHGNDISALLFDQLAFDDAVKVAIDFAQKDQETLVIITTDHGNANPGVIYGKEANKNFDSLQYFKHSNDFVLQSLTEKTSVAECQDVFKTTQQIQLNTDDAQQLLTYYQKAESENGVYNYKKLPFKALADIQKKQTSVGWISMDHSADHVEVAAYGPGSQFLKPFIRNTDLHYFMLQAAEVENKF